MSLYVYLRGDEVKKIEGFTTTLRQGGKPVQEWNEYKLSGVSIHYDENGRWHIFLSEPTDSVPAVVADIIEEVSLHKYLNNRREEGIYRYESAEAEIDRQSAGGKFLYRVRIKAKKMEDLLELFRNIKIGSIRPDESYEGQQNGLSRAELEEELKQLQDKFGNLKGHYDVFCRRLRAVQEFLDTLRASSWPFCTKSSVAKRITESLNRV